MTQPTIILSETDGGVHNRELAAANARLRKAKSYRDLSTLIVVPTRGMIPARAVENWMGLMMPMNQKVVRLFISGMEVGDAYTQAITLLLAHPELRDWKYVLTLEEDNLPPPDGLLKLYENIDDYAAVGGLYWTKGEGGQPMIYGDPHGILNFIPQVPVPEAIQECVAPETQILMADLTWRRADEVGVNEEVVSVDEEAPAGGRRRLVKSSVYGRSDFRGNRVAVHTDRGTITVSAEHLFLVRTRDYGGSLRWVRAASLLPGQGIRFVASPWTDHSDSWLSGLTDGEGNISIGPKARGVSIAQNPGPVLERAAAALEQLGVAFTRQAVNKKRWNCQRLYVSRTGDLLRFMGSLRPTRLWPDIDASLDGRLTLPRATATVGRVEDVGPGSLVALATSAKTLVTDGYVSHNCNGLGMGFTLFRLDVFKDPALEKPWFKTVQEWSQGIGAKSYTQDLFFFEKLRRAGYKVACDTRVKVGHLDSGTGIVW